MSTQPNRPPPILVLCWLIIAVAVVAILAAQAGCSKQAVRTQQLTANSLARAFNTVEPLWIERAEHEAADAALAACTEHDPACRTSAHAAADAVFDRWEPLVHAWDVAVALHEAWQDELTRCARARDTVCTIGTDLGGRFVRAVGLWRCAVRALGHPEYDPLPGAPTCASGGP